jgi:hypothetical protein
MVAVPRRFAYFLAWVVAATLMVGASWLGISSVLSAASPTRTRPLSAAELRQAAPTPTVPSPSPTPSPTPSRTPPASPTPTAKPTPSASPSAGSTDWVAEPDGHGGTAYRRTFKAQGGEATIWFARNEVRVLSATAKAGFAIDVDQPAPDSATVTFFSSRHRSRILAAWRNGPFAEVSEG